MIGPLGDWDKWIQHYCPRTAIKAKALANSVVEFILMEDVTKGATRWIVQTNGSSNCHVGGIGIILQSLEGDIIECAVWLQFPATNNETEYDALLVGINLAKAVGATSMILYCISQVIVSQVNMEYETKGEWIKKIPKLGKALCGTNLNNKFMQVPGE